MTTPLYLLFPSLCISFWMNRKQKLPFQ